MKEHVAKGGTVLGLCGGFQMLGIDIVDELGAESGMPGTDFALGLLPLTTRLEPNTAKIVRPQKGRMHIADTQVEVEGFEIHCGRTSLVMEFSCVTTEGHCCNLKMVIATVSAMGKFMEPTSMASCNTP